MKLIKKYNSNINFLISLMFLFILLSFPNLLFSQNVVSTEYINEITLIIEGKGNQKILSESISNKPSQVIINGYTKENIDYSYDLESITNIVTIKWDSPLTTCKNMFFNMDNIISIDLSKFDSSKVNEMSSMFYGCTKLESINLKNMNTSSLKDMIYMFYDCQSLKYLDLSYFDTSHVLNMEFLFASCKSLETLNLSKFNTKSVQRMHSMFKNDESLIYLDLSNFDINNVETMDSMFNGCSSLVYINFNSFVESFILKISNIFSYDINNLIYCIDGNNSPQIYNYLQGKHLDNDCENICFSKSMRKIIPEKKICVENCQDDDIYNYEYNNICYDFEHYQEKIAKEKTEINKLTEYINISVNPEITHNFKKNEPTNGIEITNIQIITEIIQKIETTIEEEIIEKTNNVDIEKTENTEKNTVDKIDNKSNDDYQNQNFSSINFFKNNKNINNEDLNNDKIIELIKYDLLNGNLNSLLENVTKLKQDLIVENNDIIFQITTTENQKNNNYSNISNINLGLCEDRLKTIYGIDKNLSLIILKIDYFMSGLLIPVIGYEIYHPINNSQLDLKYCEDILVKINIPVSINENYLYKYDPNSEYYNDECYTYTTENGTDIILNDRQNEFINNNLSLCEENCSYNGYYTDTKKALCECHTKLKINSISEVISEINILSNDFNNKESNNINLATMKCINQLFSKDGLLTNIGNYILLFIIIIFCISIIIFTKFGFYLIEEDFKKKLKELSKNIKKDISKNDNKKKKKKKVRKISNPIKKQMKRKINKSNKKLEVKFNEKSDLKISTNQIISFDKSKYDNKNIFIGKKKKNWKKNNGMESFLDCELNYLNYEEALLYDKRTYYSYYISLLKMNHPILLAFYPYKDYNIKIIKMDLFFQSFAIYFAINTLFFNKSSIHKIYEDGGVYNISYFIPQIILSFIISFFISDVIKYLFLSGRNILELRYMSNLKNEKIINIKRCLKIKYILFFILSEIFLILFWYYLSSFCAIYQNSQVYLIKNTLISFTLSLFFPIIINLFTSLLRLNSLKNKNKKCIFKISKIMQTI